MTIEGVLENLRSIRNYVGMHYFIEQLNNIRSSSSHIIRVKCMGFWLLSNILKIQNKKEYNELKN